MPQCEEAWEGQSSFPNSPRPAFNAHLRLARQSQQQPKPSISRCEALQHFVCSCTSACVCVFFALLLVEAMGRVLSLAQQPAALSAERGYHPPPPAGPFDVQPPALPPLPASPVPQASIRESPPTPIAPAPALQPLLKKPHSPPGLPPLRRLPPTQQPPMQPPPLEPSPPPPPEPLAPYVWRGTTVGELNARFKNGGASSELAKTGVLLHMFDKTEGLDSPAWLPCRADDLCGQFSDRISASIVNAAVRVTFASNRGGIVLSPTASNIHCSYFSDGGTMNKFCKPPAPAGCVPGCANSLTSQPEWCRPADIDEGGDM